MPIEFNAWESTMEVQEAGPTLPDGAYLVSVDSFMEDVSASGKLMYPAQFRVVEPAAYANRVLFERYVVGTDDDANGDDPQTWQKSIAVGRMSRLFRGAGLARNLPVSALGHQVVGQRVLAVVGTQVEREFKKDGSKNEYAGQRRNVIRNYYLPGEREIKVDGAAAAHRPVVTAPRAATGPKATVGAPPEPPVVTAMYGAGETAKPVAARTRAAKAPAEVKFKCGNCGVSVARSQYGKHVEACVGGVEAPADVDE